MQLLYDLWERVVDFWKYIWGVQDAEELTTPFNPRERIYDIDVAELVKLIYYKKGD